ncbi:MAG TPA: MFS transporter [Candidatus Hydrothermia bacterium]|nr:MFS transporter [Candidatus Hydrothermae bacterium]MDD3649731.1 MFS transporter [Candidatus Hydrothermia bacterium]MDD5572658.1 MFS transporter [Candidatus Hydrothermia bacterium]HOP33168.1 MFS transporter [Candidatus Hydrothermia bacterium]HRD23479.1 MFS transporter [Candidatus Hydrothermia bacterium]
MKEQDKVQKALKTSIKEGVAYSIMEGMGLRYITPYALLLGASNKIIGFLTSIPQIASAIIQLFSLRILGGKVSRKKLSFWGALLQAIFWLPIISLEFFYFVLNKRGPMIPIALIGFYTILVAAGSIFAPAWSSWMKDLVDEKTRGSYFGKRNRIVGFASLSSMVVAGYLLDVFKKINAYSGFLLIFSIAMISRFISAFLLKQQHEPPFKSHKSYYFTLWEFIRIMPQSNFGRFTAFVNLFTFSVSIASPFFAVYMLKYLKLSYLQFTLVNFASSIASLLSMPLWGKLGDRYGNLKIVKTTSSLIPLVPAMWALTTFVKSNFVFFILLLIELYSGFLWAGYNLSSSNFVYDAVTRQKLPICVTYYNILNAVMTFIGATIGGFLASYNILRNISAGNIIQVFIISAIFRFLSAIIILPHVKEVKKVEMLELKKVRQMLLGPIDNLLFQISFKIRNPRG